MGPGKKNLPHAPHVFKENQFFNAKKKLTMRIKATLVIIKNAVEKLAVCNLGQ